MLILANTTDQLQIVLGGAITTNQLRCVSSWRDIAASTFTPGRTVTNTNSTTDVDAVPAPAASTQRVIDFINVYNSDTVAATVTLKYDASGTEYIVWKGSLDAGESVQFVEGAGWTKVSTSGAPILGSITAVNGTANEITATTVGTVVTLSLPTSITLTGKTLTDGTFVNPALGTPASGNLANCTGYPGTTALVTGGAMSVSSLASSGAVSGTTGGFTSTVSSTNATQADLNLVKTGTGARTFSFYVDATTAGWYSGGNILIHTTAANTLTATPRIVASGGIDGVIGATTPAAGSFTTLAASGQITNTRGTGGLTLASVSGNTTGVYQTFQTSAGVKAYFGTGDQVLGGGSVNDIGITSDTGNIFFGSSSAYRGIFSSTGLSVTGTLAASGLLSVGGSTPASASAAGVAGTITWDASYIYVCTATNTWKRVAIATW